METERHNKGTVSRPRDQSVEAYKVWMMEIAERLTTGKNKIELTEAEWRLHCREYWKEKAGGRYIQRATFQIDEHRTIALWPRRASCSDRQLDLV
jgi:hypothetical protein